MPAAPLADSSTETARTPDNVAPVFDRSAVASRWPDATNAVPPTAATPSRNSGNFEMAAAESNPPPNLAPAPAVTPAALTATDTAVETPAVTPGIDSSRTRLAALLGAIALAGFSTSVLLARARARRRVRLEPAMASRRTRWPVDAEIDRMQLPEVDRLHPAIDLDRAPAARRTSQLSIVPADEARYDDQYEVEDLLSRYSGQRRSEG
jgi:hypothetical protein